MYHFSYGEVVEDAGTGSRERERLALDKSIELLREANEKGSGNKSVLEALIYVRRLWSILLEDLAQPGNDLPVKLRADLISIGVWIMKEADRLQSLMDRLLTPHRLPQLIQFNIHEALERVRSLLLAEFPTGIAVLRDYDVSLPPFTADREQILQALLNIARNAAQAMQGQGEIRLRTRIARRVTLARKTYRLGLLVQIIDNGPGIPEETLGTLFQRFSRGSALSSGLGLGLYIAREIVIAHGGSIDVGSTVGAGTTVTIMLPALDDAPAG